MMNVNIITKDFVITSSMIVIVDILQLYEKYWKLVYDVYDSYSVNLVDM